MVKVKKALNYSPFLWRTEKDGSHVLKRTATLCLDLRHGGIDKTAKVRFCGESTDGRGFRCDGLSVPLLFRWFLPSWDEKNMLYNVSGALHDWLYTTKGNFGMFSREECDDFFRGCESRELVVSRPGAPTRELSGSLVEMPIGAMTATALHLLREWR